MTGSNILAWTPPYDNYDGSEKFWKHYELSLLDEDDKALLLADEFITPEDMGNAEWAYVWSVMIYYSTLVIGGNEMQPA